MKIRFVPAVLFGLLFAWTSSLSAQTPEAVTKMIADWEKAFNAGEAATIASFYTEDAVRVPPGMPMIHGHDEIMADVESYAGMSIKLTATGGMLGEEIGTSWGAYELSGTIEGEAVSQKGEWMNALKKTEEGWMIYRDTWNIAAPEDE
jgi:uncharacterized protein (TIGR02246 family)